MKVWEIITAIVIAFVFTASAEAQCCRKSGSCARPAAAISRQTNGYSSYVIPSGAAMQAAMRAAAQQQVLAQQLYTQRQKAIREIKKQRGAAIAAQREAEEAIKEKSEKPRRAPSSLQALLDRAKELEGN